MCHVEILEWTTQDLTSWILLLRGVNCPIHRGKWAQWRTRIRQQKLTDNTCSAISNLVILRVRQLNQQLSNLMLNIHLLQYCSTIICDCDISIGRYKQLVQTFWSKWRLHNVSNSFGCQDVWLATRAVQIHITQPCTLNMYNKSIMVLRSI